MYQPTDFDLDILRLLRDSQPLTESEIEKKLPKVQAVPLRIRDLSARPSDMFPGSPRRSPPDDAYIHPESGQYWGPRTRYVLTPLGMKTLQDAALTRRKDRRDLWLRNAWIPILVSLFTNLILGALQQLLPQILQWASSFLSTIS